MPPKLNAPQANHGRGALIDIQTVRLHFPEERNTLFALGPTASTGGVPRRDLAVQANHWILQGKPRKRQTRAATLRLCASRASISRIS